MENAGKAPAVESPREIFLRLMSEDSSGGWEKSWEEEATPWDLGKPTPIIVHLTETGSLPNGRALVPGCGTGYDVVAMACPDRHVVGLDVSKTAVERSTKKFSSLPNAKYFSFLNEDFFTWEPAEKFDLIVDYTFFCAFEPSVRPLWAQRMEKLLKPGGELITLMFPIEERAGGPPYTVSVSEYEKVLIPLGFKATSIVDNELAVGPRKGIEKIGRWKKPCTLHSTFDLPMDIREPLGGWEQIWVEGRTLWDLGEATPIVVHLCETGSLPNGRALVPGCGTGYDVVVMANPDRYVVGLDISKTSVERSTKMFSSLPNSKHFSFLEENFFTWEPTEKFDLIFDYNFFCAFEPKVRPLWAKRMEQLLKPGGELITLIFPLDDRVGGPPYQVSVSDYEELLIPLGFEVISIVNNELAIDTRKGEKVGRWKKKSSL